MSKERNRRHGLDSDDDSDASSSSQESSVIQPRRSAGPAKMSDFILSNQEQLLLYQEQDEEEAIVQSQIEQTQIEEDIIPVRGRRVTPGEATRGRGLPVRGRGRNRQQINSTQTNTEVEQIKPAGKKAKDDDDKGPKPDDPVDAPSTHAAVLQQNQQIEMEIENELRQQGDTVIHEVVLQNNPELLQELIRRGIRIFNQSTYDGATALHRAAEVDSLECAQILIEQNADIDATNFKGQTALHIAAEHESQEVAQFLIKNGARRSCRPNCRLCRPFSQKVVRALQLARQRESRLRREEIKAEQAQKEAEERLANPDLTHELAKLREELGGPFFTEEENAAHREEVQQAMREYGQDMIQPRKQHQHHTQIDSQQQESIEAKKMKKKLKNKKRKQNRTSKARAPQETLEEAKIDEAPGSGSDEINKFGIIPVKQEEMKQPHPTQELEQLSDSPKSEKPKQQEVIKPRNQRKKQ